MKHNVMAVVDRVEKLPGYNGLFIIITTAIISIIFIIITIIAIIITTIIITTIIIIKFSVLLALV